MTKPPPAVKLKVWFWAAIVHFATLAIALWVLA